MISVGKDTFHCGTCGWTHAKLQTPFGAFTAEQIHDMTLRWYVEKHPTRCLVCGISVDRQTKGEEGKSFLCPCGHRPTCKKQECMEQGLATAEKVWAAYELWQRVGRISLCPCKSCYPERGMK